MDRYYRSCSWCHAENEVTPGLVLPPVFCNECGHRADLPRVACDCEKCQMGGHELTPCCGARYDVAIVATLLIPICPKCGRTF